MSKRIIIVATALLLTIAFGFLGCKTYGTQQYRAKQSMLADELGVKITDYENSEEFPIGYFISILQPGMNTEEVHTKIIGYEKVYNCSWWGEIYYFYSSEDNKALRFVIQYDKNLNFEYLQGEDLNSRTISISDCVPGLFK
jgi:hypothetical protein